MLDSVLFLHFQMWDLTTALEIVSKQSGETTGELVDKTVYYLSLSFLKL